MPEAPFPEVGRWGDHLSQRGVIHLSAWLVGEGHRRVRVRACVRCDAATQNDG